jgi:hypothetical protein
MDEKLTQEEQLERLLLIAEQASIRQKDLEALKENSAFQFILEQVDKELELMKYPYALTKDTVDFYKGKYVGLLILHQAMGGITAELGHAMANYKIAEERAKPRSRNPFEA